MKFRWIYILYFTTIIMVLSVVVDLIRISGYKVIPSLPQKRINTETDEIYYELANGAKDINWERLNNTLIYINAQYDVADFHMATLLRIIYEYRDRIPADKLTEIKNTVLKFRYWMDEPGENAMCYWSENHQVLFASAEYLAGQLYPNEIFPNSGLTGRQHLKKAEKRILDWLEMRWKYGFSEFYSTVYYNEDIAGMINLIDFAKDSIIVKKTEIIMDLLIYDIASQKLGDTFVSVSGRAYERGRKGGKKLSSRTITNYIWNNIKTARPHINYAFITSKIYKVPPVLIDIGNDSSDVIIKQSNGLDISRLEAEGYGGSDDRSIMMQWGMEAFSNSQVVRNSMDYIRRNNMFSNEFLNEIKYLDFSWMRFFHLEPAIINIVNPQSNGAAIQQARTYTYKTKDYSVYTVQNYHPGDYANQDHVTGMNAGTSFSVFHTHPALPKTFHNQSPNYWVGYGRLPQAAQDSNISLSIYNLPGKANIYEMAMLDFTHAYFPKEKFDTVIIKNNYAFGKTGKTYCALIGRNKLYYKKNSTDDLIQKGRQVFWIIEAGSEDEDGTFNNFCTRILKNKVTFDPDKLILTYFNNYKELKLKYESAFYINDSKVNTNYGRYESPYIKANYKPDSLVFRYKNKTLHLDFEKMIRKFN